MKNKILILIACMVIAFSPTIFASSAILSREEFARNTLDISVEQNLGFVTSLNFSLKLEGDVSLKKLTWSSNIKSDYYKRYVYDSNTNVVNIYVVAPNKQNIVTQNQTIPVCSIEVEPKYNNSTFNIKLSTQDIVIVNNSYEKVVLTAVENDNNTFTTYKEDTKPEEPENPDNKPEIPEEPNEPEKPVTPPDQDENNTPNVNPGDNNNGNTTNGSNNNNNSQNTGNDQVVDNSNNNGNNATDTTNPDNVTKDEADKEFDAKVNEAKMDPSKIAAIIVMIVLIIVIIILIVYMIRRKKKGFIG